MSLFLRDTNESTYNNADDWLILPPVIFDNCDNVYTFSLEAWEYYEDYYDPETFEVFMGDAPTPEALTRQLLSETEVNSFTHKESKAFFSIENPGVKYFGIHVTSDAYLGILMVNNIRIANAGFTTEAPAAASELSAVAAPEGKLSANISFRLPIARINGEPLNSDDLLRAEIQGAETLYVLGNPGTVVSADIPTLDGDNIIEVRCGLNGEFGMPSTVLVYTGVDIPGEVTDIKVVNQESPYQAIVSWSAPEAGANGNYIDKDALSYSLFIFDNENFDWVNIGTTSKPLSLIEMPDDTALDSYTFGIVAQNKAGDSYMTYFDVTLGSPYALPAKEEFTGGRFQLTPSYVDRSFNRDADPEWRIKNPTEYKDEFANESGIALCGSLASGIGKSLFVLPNFSTRGQKDVYLDLSVWRGKDAASFKVMGLCYGLEEMMEIGEISPGGDGWTQFQLQFPTELCDRQWVSLYIIADFGTTGTYVLIDNYEVKAGTVGVNNITALPTLSVNGKELHIANASGQEVVIVTLNGVSIVAEKAASDNVVYNLEKGIYFVRVGFKENKIFIR